jgi:hypothetical protein
MESSRSSRYVRKIVDERLMVELMSEGKSW